MTTRLSVHLSTIWVIARRDLSTRARSKAFRISSVVVLVSVILGIVIPAVFLRGTTRYTVAVIGPPGGPLPAAVSTQAAAAGITVTTVAATDRAAGVRHQRLGHRHSGRHADTVSRNPAG